MKQSFGYIRVSTPKQGEGVSLEVQKADIEDFAKKTEQQISQWFIEKKSAAKTNRPEFIKMMHLLEKNKADGVIFHKLDRGSRNRDDWAWIARLNEKYGLSVAFAHEGLTMNTRSEILSLDIQAVMASDYIRNLREETFKGIRGRLNQGILPNGAPIGYLNTGKGKPKAIDKTKAPLIKEAFEKYATGNYSLNELRESLHKKGLTSMYDNILSNSAFSKMLHNPFYTGIIHYKRTGEVFQGKHEPIISSELFNKVQEQLGNKVFAKKSKHDFLFRSRIYCQLCERVLIGERQKGRVYYRCHNKACPTTSIREDKMESIITTVLKNLVLPKPVQKELEDHWQTLQKDTTKEADIEVAKTNLELGKQRDRLKRVNDKFVDDLIDHDTFVEIKNQCVKMMNHLEQQLTKIKENKAKTPREHNTLELSQIAYLTYKTGDKEQKRSILENTHSNFFGDHRKPIVKLKAALWELLNMHNLAVCAQHTHIPRTICSSCTIKKNKNITAKTVLKKLDTSI